MCGRYRADDKVNEWLLRRCRFRGDNVGRLGDICPGEDAPVIIGGSPVPLAVSMKWGLQGHGGLIINARKETIGEKPMFRHLMEKRRCLLPAACFYEWDRERRKAVLYGKEDEVLFLAGVYREDGRGGRFVIITAPAGDTVRPIHEREPVRIPEALLGDWLAGGGSGRQLLDISSVPLRREESDEQLSLWGSERV